MTKMITGTYATGVYLNTAADNPTTIASTGLLTDGLHVSFTGLAVVNAGTIITEGATTNVGVFLTAAGSVTNQSGGMISGANYGIVGFGVSVTVTVVNAGSIAGSTTNGDGVFLLSGGSVTNQSGGAISGYNGIYGADAVTVVNAGTITGDNDDAVKFAAGSANRLVIDPNAVFSGTVTGGNTIGAAHVSTLELASAGSAGTLSGLGTQFVDFAQVTVDAGASWTLNATDTVQSGVTLNNYGTLSGTVTLAPGGVLSNASTGTVTVSSESAVDGAAGGAATVVNAGVIAGSDASGGPGIDMAAGGSVTNQSGGSISGGKDGIVGYNATVTVVNTGSIVGSFAGIGLYLGGSVTNQSGGSISSGRYGIVGEYAAVTVVNAGSIAGSGYGVFLSGGGSVTNQSGGAITGGIDGIFGSDAAVTVVNAGTISGSGDAVNLLAGYANRLVIDPNAVFSGMVDGGNAIGAVRVSTLELASSGSAGTLSGLGTKYVDFAQVTVDTGAQWTLAGADTLAAGATLTNAGTLIDAGSLTNAGTLSGMLTLAPVGVLLNASTGTITAPAGAAVYGTTGGAATVVNSGVIAGYDGLGGRGIDLAAGGSVTNQSGGAISGFDGISGYAGAMTVVNAGNIAGNVFGVYLQTGGSVSNQSGGAISGFDGISGAVGAVTVVNAGTVAGLNSGVELDAGGSVTNQSGGGITGGDGIFGDDAVTVVNAGRITGSSEIGVLLTAGGCVTNQSDGAISGSDGIVGGGALTVVNAGTISGTTDAVEFGGGAGYANRLIADPGAVFTGAVYGGGGVLELASAASAGTLSGLGTGITNFSTLQFDAGAAWTVSGSDSSGRPLGTIAITGFADNDTIDLTGFVATGETFANNTLVLTNGTAQATLNIEGGFTSSLFHLSSDGNGGTDVTLCFCAGTHIGTPTGEVPVEHLQIGDPVLTAHNGPHLVTWIGQGKVLATRCRRSAATPVIVRKGALADNVPNRDLHVTKAHSLYIDHVLIPVEFLVNHRTILWDDRAQEVAIYHVELDSHDVLLANGAPAESYRDDGNRWLFQNANAGWHLPPQAPYAPVLTGGPVVDAVWRRLLDRAGPRRLPPLTDDPDLHLVVDGTRVDAEERQGSVYVFRLPLRPKRVVIASREAVPAELGIARDPRSLGVALRQAAVRQGGKFTLFDAADERLTVGFHTYEADGHLRWTDGYAELPAEAFARFDKGAEVMLHLGGATQYPNGRVSPARAAA
jgi:hypothetical protein